MHARAKQYPIKGYHNLNNYQYVTYTVQNTMRLHFTMRGDVEDEAAHDRGCHDRYLGGQGTASCLQIARAVLINKTLWRGIDV